MLTSADVKQQARALGFDLCGIAPAAALPELAYLEEWLARGYAGEMVYMHKSAATRADIRNFRPSARSVIVTGTFYHTEGSGGRDRGAGDGDQGAADRERGSGGRGPAPDRVRVARYARGDDYHVVLAGRLEALVAWMRERHREPFDAAVFVDKHHVQERVFARHAGIGWIGKNCCVINPELGSWMLLAGVATSLPLAPDAPASDQCGDCTLCLDACPTGALVDAHVLDARKCISYLTIELQGPIPAGQRADLGNHLFGCDICQEVCPWNLGPPVTSDPAWQPRPRDGARATELWQRTDQELQGLVRGSAMLHTSLARLRRNLAIIIGNAGDSAAAAALDRPGHGIRNAAHSAQTPVVQEAVAWARARLALPAAPDA
ncbi:MAG: tRNA epoxyqueuosine(34) reductase QueG [Vicinamibacterales bacterium]